MRLPIALVIALLALMPPASAQHLINLSRTADGQFVVTDHPPTDALDDGSSDVNSPAGPARTPKFSAVEVLRGAPRPAPTPRRGEVTLFAADWCPYCRQARAYLAERRIGYVEYDIDTADGRAAFAQAGGGGIPLIFYGDRRLRGFSAAAYDALFQTAKPPAKTRTGTKR